MKRGGATFLAFFMPSLNTSMEIITPKQIQEWLRIDPETDETTLSMLVSSAIDLVEYKTGRTLRPHCRLNIDTGETETVTPPVPESLKHAIALFVSSHFDDRAGANDEAMVAVDRMCRPFWMARL